MPDYSFFALLFLIASSLVPQNSAVIRLENATQSAQNMQWTRNASGAWALVINERELGTFRREGHTIVHRLQDDAEQRHSVPSLVNLADLERPRPSEVHLRGQFGPTVLEITHQGPRLTISDPSGRMLVHPLIVRHQNQTPPNASRRKTFP